MCGIGGIYNGGGGSIPLKPLKALWRALEARGEHAAGFALQWTDADEPIVVKQAGPSTRLHKRLSKFVGDGSTTQYVMLHTRYTTQGSVKNNANNHPVVSAGMIVTHNGVLFNDSNVMARLLHSPIAEVDTEAINAGLRHESAGWVLDEVDGSMSVAWVDSTNTPNTVNLMTNGQNPLVIARTESNHIVWASTKSILDEAGFDIKSFFHATPFKVYTLTPDGIIRSELVSEQREKPDYGYALHAASRPQWWEMGTTSSRAPARPQKRLKRGKKAKRGKKQKPSALNAIPSRDNKGMVWVYRRNGWSLVRESEVSL